MQLGKVKFNFQTLLYIIYRWFTSFHHGTYHIRKSKTKEIKKKAKTNKNQKQKIQTKLSIHQIKQT